MSPVNGTPTDTPTRPLPGPPQHPRPRAEAAEPQPPHAAPVAPVRLRRRGLIAAGVALIALGALTAASLVRAVANTFPVVAVAIESRGVV
jgi:hypothetical protein